MKKIPFPQANSLERIYVIFFSVADNGISKFDLVKTQGLDEREGAYYLDALYFLKLLEKYNTKYFLSDIGQKILVECKEDGRHPFANYVKNAPFFKEIYDERINFPDKSKYREFIAERICNTYGLGINTAYRRASTVASWLLWIDDNLEG